MPPVDEAPFKSAIAADDTIDFGDAVTEVEETTPEPEVSEPEVVAHKEEPTKEPAPTMDEDALADKLMAKMNAKKPEPAVEAKQQQKLQDFLDEFLASPDLDKENPNVKLITALASRFSKTQDELTKLKEQLGEHGKFIGTTAEEKRIAQLKSEAGDLNIDELKSEAAKQANELMGFSEDYKPQDDEDGRAWIKVANRLYKKVLDEKKKAKTPESEEPAKPSMKPVSRTEGKPSSPKSAAEKLIMNDEIDFG